MMMVTVIMIMIMTMTVAMVMMVVVMVVVVVAMIMMVMMIMFCHQTAFASTESGAKRTIFDITAGGRYAFAFYMVMVTFLRQTHLFFKA
jgi:hypothetical protein